MDGGGRSAGLGFGRGDGRREPGSGLPRGGGNDRPFLLLERRIDGDLAGSLELVRGPESTFTNISSNVTTRLFI